MSEYAELKARLLDAAKALQSFYKPGAVELIHSYTMQQAAAAIDALERERDATLKREHDANVAAMDHKRRADAADARVNRLEGALRHIDALDPESEVDGFSVAAMRGAIIRMGETARAALKEKPTNE